MIKYIYDRLSKRISKNPTLIDLIISSLDVHIFKNLIYSNRHTRKPASMVTHSVRLVMKAWKEDTSNVTEKMTV